MLSPSLRHLPKLQTRSNPLGVPMDLDPSICNWNSTKNPDPSPDEFEVSRRIASLETETLIDAGNHSVIAKE